MQHMEPAARAESATRKGKEKKTDRMKAAMEAQEKRRPSSDPREERTDLAARVDCAARSQRGGKTKKKKKKDKE
jgi:hypothetical protein